MDDPLSGLTKVSRARISAAFQQLDHRLRRRQIHSIEWFRSAYSTCAQEMPHEAAVALVARYARVWGWLSRADQEAEQQAVIAGMVADLIHNAPEAKGPQPGSAPTEQAAAPAAKQTRYPARAAWLRARLGERGWNKHDLARYGGPDYKSTQKVLDGFPVQDGVLQKIAQGLSARRAKVTLTDIPQN
jgi:hypothetical protein